MERPRPKVVLEIGAGIEPKRAQLKAAMDPATHIIALDYQMKGTESGRKNLTLVKEKMSAAAVRKALDDAGLHKVDEVWMYHTGNPFLFNNETNRLASRLYKWLHDDNSSWLSERHKVVIMDTATSIGHEKNLKEFTRGFLRMRDALAHKGYDVRYELVPYEEIPQITSYDITAKAVKQMVRITLEKK
jgi:hypothetical protein